MGQGREIVVWPRWRESVRRPVRGLMPEWKGIKAHPRFPFKTQATTIKWLCSLGYLRVLVEFHWRIVEESSSCKGLLDNSLWLLVLTGYIRKPKRALKRQHQVGNVMILPR